jgi:glucose-fructose oxidoreductase
MEQSTAVRYAVVGLGYISQIAVLPAFAHARRNSVLAALVSDDPVKLRKLSKKYGVPQTYSYEQYDRCLNSGNIDAVYIALPNNQHHEYVVRAASSGIHSLCEKPLGVTEQECEDMISAASENNVKLMTAYRLHFDEANLKAISIAQSGRLGDVRIFNSVFSQQIKPGNIRLKSSLGGGTFFDMGIYCVNAARYLFKDEPMEVFAYSANNGDGRFKEIDEMTAAVVRFPRERLATMTSSFGAAAVGWYEIVGTKGSLRGENAYEYSRPREHVLTINEKTTKQRFPVRDQFAPELLYFSDCIINDRKPEPSGEEGLADVRIIEAIYRSAQKGRPVEIERVIKRTRQTRAMEVKRPKVKKPSLVHASTPST